MVNCPACEQTVDEDFGMVTCPHCKAVFMIDYSGKIEYGTEENNEIDDLVEEDEPEEIESEPTVSGYDFPEPEDDSSDLDELSDEDDSVQDDFITNDFDEDEVSQPEENAGFMESEEADFPVSQEDDFEPEEEEVEAEPVESDFQSDLTSEAEVESAFVDDSDEDDFSDAAESTVLAPDNAPVDVTEFANSEESLLEGGEYLYSVTVSRIDSKDLRDDLKYVLMDEKLKLNHHEHIKNIVDGSVTIPDLHPIKAKRIVEQLQFFDLEVQWHQKRVIMEEPVEEDVYEDLEDDE